MNIKLSEIEDLLNKISDCISYYETSCLKNKSFLLYLGNGGKIKYTINPINLPHLLGIKDLDTLKKILGIKCENVLDTLKILPDYAYQILNKLNGGILNCEQIFSKFIDKKVDNFKSNLTSNADEILDQTLFICSYVSERSWEHTIKNQKYDYIIVKQLEDGKISLLCLVENQGQYYAMSNQLFDNMEAAKEILNDLVKNQEITLLTGISIYNFYTDSVYNRTLSINQKLDKIDKMRQSKSMFEYYIDISNDYEYTINKLRSNRNERNENNNIIEEIVSSITKKSLINRDTYEDSTLLSIIDAWNDHICNNASNANESNFSYTEIIKELKAAKELVTTLQKEKEKLEEKVLNQEQSINALTDENNEYKVKAENTLRLAKSIIKITNPEN